MGITLREIEAGASIEAGCNVKFIPKKANKNPKKRKDHEISKQIKKSNESLYFFKRSKNLI